MYSGLHRADGFRPARLLVALVGVLALLANAAPGSAHNIAVFYADGDLVYDVRDGDYAVIPKLERDQRQRASAAAPAAGEKPPPPGGLLPVGEPPQIEGSPRADRVVVRFYHLDERSALVRAPPHLV